MDMRDSVHRSVFFSVELIDSVGLEGLGNPLSLQLHCLETRVPLLGVTATLFSEV